MYKTTMLNGLTDMMKEVTVWFVGVDVSDYVNNGGYRAIVSVHATKEDAKKAFNKFNKLEIGDDRTSIHETTLLDVVCEMAMKEYFSGARWREGLDEKKIQHYEKKAEQAEQKIKAELLETITKILK